MCTVTRIIQFNFKINKLIIYIDISNVQVGEITKQLQRIALISLVFQVM